MHAVLDLEYDEVFEAFPVPVEACQERAAQSVPFRTLVSHCWCQLMFAPHNHGMASIDGVGQERCRCGFRCLPGFVCQNEECVRAVELRTLHVRGEDHRVSPLGDCLSDQPVDDGFLCVLACGPPCLFGDGELHASMVKDGVALAESADFVVAPLDTCGQAGCRLPCSTVRLQ